MPLLSELELPRPKNWQDFETMCWALWKDIWRDPNAQKNGRSGQPQHGVDVFGRPCGSQKYHGVQCKGKDVFTHKNVTVEILQQEIAKAETFSPPLEQFVLATTGQRDAAIQNHAREISENRLKTNQFPVAVFSWDDIQYELAQRPDLCLQFYPQLIRNHTPSDLETIRQFYQAMDRYAFRVAMHLEEPREFFQALSDTRIAITTGTIRLSDGQKITQVKGKSLLQDSNARSTFDKVADLLFLMESTWNAAIQDGRVRDRVASSDESLLTFMDDTRNQIIEIANLVFVQYGLSPLRSIRAPAERGLFYTTTHSMRWGLLSHRYPGDPPRMLPMPNHETVMPVFPDSPSEIPRHARIEDQDMSFGDSNQNPEVPPTR